MVDALQKITKDDTAPLRIMSIWGDARKVNTGPKDTERQQVVRERSFTFFMVDEIGP